jgi:DNA polymerase-1
VDFIADGQARPGRLTAVNPNLQNIPIRSADGKLIRKAFVAAPQHTLLKADYSQVPLSAVQPRRVR